MPDTHRCGYTAADEPRGEPMPDWYRTLDLGVLADDGASTAVREAAGEALAYVRALRKERANLSSDLTWERSAADLAHSTVDRLAGQVAAVRALADDLDPEREMHIADAIRDALDGPADASPSVSPKQPQSEGDEPCVCDTRWTCMAAEHMSAPPWLCGCGRALPCRHCPDRDPCREQAAMTGISCGVGDKGHALPHRGWHRHESDTSGEWAVYIEWPAPHRPDFAARPAVADTETGEELQRMRIVELLRRRTSSSEDPT